MPNSPCRAHYELTRVIPEAESVPETYTAQQPFQNLPLPPSGWRLIPTRLIRRHAPPACSILAVPAVDKRYSLGSRKTDAPYARH